MVSFCLWKFSLIDWFLVYLAMLVALHRLCNSKWYDDSLLMYRKRWTNHSTKMLSVVVLVSEKSFWEPGGLLGWIYQYVKVFYYNFIVTNGKHMVFLYIKWHICTIHNIKISRLQFMQQQYSQILQVVFTYVCSSFRTI